jgi:prepilin signal peptidase PulO-like enzyme (type II secretory pathway)
MIKRNHRIIYRRSFPTLGFIILVFAGLWLLRDMNVIDWQVPWLPIVLIVIAIGIIFNRLII